LAQISSRQKAIKKNITGGTTAPASAGQGVFPHTQLGGQWAPKGEIKSTKYAQGMGAAPQPGAAAPVQAQPVMPWDAAAANSEGAALQKRNNSLTGLDSGWLREQQDYGLEGPWADPASNPYSRAALLQRSYDNAKRGSLNTAGNQLYAGSYVNSQNSNTHNFSLGRDELQKGYDADYAQYQGGRQAAEDQYRGELAQAGWDRVNAGLSMEPEPAPVPGAPGAPAKKGKPAPRKAQVKANIAPARKAK
jgi:hypothetical protein